MLKLKSFIKLSIKSFVEATKHTLLRWRSSAVWAKIHDRLQQYAILARQHQPRRVMLKLKSFIKLSIKSLVDSDKTHPASLAFINRLGKNPRPSSTIRDIGPPASAYWYILVALADIVGALAGGERLP